MFLPERNPTVLFINTLFAFELIFFSGEVRSEFNKRNSTSFNQCKLHLDRIRSAVRELRGNYFPEMFDILIPNKVSN